jgi:hypothetical protein
MSPDEVRACFRLYAAYRMSREIGPFGRMLATLTMRRGRRRFIATFAQIANLR